MDYEKYGKMLLSELWDDLFQNRGVPYEEMDQSAEKALEAALKLLREGEENAD